MSYLTPTRVWRGFIALLLGGLALPAAADGLAVDKIYHPYVQPLERELELRGTGYRETREGRQRVWLSRAGYGQAVSDTLFLEGYLIFEDSEAESLRLEAYELELLWQLTEQGEYFADFGLLFELEKGHRAAAWEFSARLLAETETGRFSHTLNASLTQEWGSEIDDELETALAWQSRYRYRRGFEPALELFVAQETLAAGPMALGQVKLRGTRSLMWQAGVIFGLDSTTPDEVIKLSLEYEF